MEMVRNLILFVVISFAAIGFISTSF